MIQIKQSNDTPTRSETEDTLFSGQFFQNGNKKIHTALLIIEILNDLISHLSSHSIHKISKYGHSLLRELPQRARLFSLGINKEEHNLSHPTETNDVDETIEICQAFLMNHVLTPIVRERIRCQLSEDSEELQNEDTIQHDCCRPSVLFQPPIQLQRLSSLVPSRQSKRSFCSAFPNTPCRMPTPCDVFSPGEQNIIQPVSATANNWPPVPSPHIRGTPGFYSLCRRFGTLQQYPLQCTELLDIGITDTPIHHISKNQDTVISSTFNHPTQLQQQDDNKQDEDHQEQERETTTQYQQDKQEQDNSTIDLSKSHIDDKESAIVPVIQQTAKRLTLKKKLGDPSRSPIPESTGLVRHLIETIERKTPGRFGSCKRLNERSNKKPDHIGTKRLEIEHRLTHINESCETPRGHDILLQTDTLLHCQEIIPSSQSLFLLSRTQRRGPGHLPESFGATPIPVRKSLQTTDEDDHIKQECSLKNNTIIEDHNNKSDEQIICFDNTDMIRTNDKTAVDVVVMESDEDIQDRIQHNVTTIQQHHPLDYPFDQQFKTNTSHLNHSFIPIDINKHTHYSMNFRNISKIHTIYSKTNDVLFRPRPMSYDPSSTLLSRQLDLGLDRLNPKGANKELVALICPDNKKDAAAQLYLNTAETQILPIKYRGEYEQPNSHNTIHHETQQQTLVEHIQEHPLIIHERDELPPLLLNSARTGTPTSHDSIISSESSQQLHSIETTCIDDTSPLLFETNDIVLEDNKQSFTVVSKELNDPPVIETTHNSESNNISLISRVPRMNGTPPRLLSEGLDDIKRLTPRTQITGERRMHRMLKRMRPKNLEDQADLSGEEDNPCVIKTGQKEASWAKQKKDWHMIVRQQIDIDPLSIFGCGVKPIVFEEIFQTPDFHRAARDIMNKDEHIRERAPDLLSHESRRLKARKWYQDEKTCGFRDYEGVTKEEVTKFRRRVGRLKDISSIVWESTWTSCDQSCDHDSSLRQPWFRKLYTDNSPHYSGCRGISMTTSNHTVSAQTRRYMSPLPLSRAELPGVDEEEEDNDDNDHIQTTDPITSGGAPEGYTRGIFCTTGPSTGLNCSKISEDQIFTDISVPTNLSLSTPRHHGNNSGLRSFKSGNHLPTTNIPIPVFLTANQDSSLRHLNSSNTTDSQTVRESRVFRPHPKHTLKDQGIESSPSRLMGNNSLSLFAKLRGKQ